MCGRATLTASPDDLREVFDLETVPAEMPPRFNIAPTQPLPILRELGHLELVPWGSAKRRIVNVKVETASVVPQNRCLVVVDGFYEWRDGDRQPFYFYRHDHRPFALAGALLGGGTTAAIVTCPPEGIVAELHDRMPLILAPGDWRRWLAGERPAPTLAQLDRHAVSKFVNDARNDDARCIERV